MMRILMLASLSSIKGDTQCAYLTYFYRGKIQAHVWDFPAPIIPCEESRVWPWHICFPTFLRPLGSPPPDSVFRAAGAENRCHIYTPRGLFSGSVKTRDRERGLCWLLNLLFQSFSPFFSTLICRLLHPGVYRLLSWTQTVTWTWIQHRLPFTDCFE